MSDRIQLAIYAAFVLAVSFVHDPLGLAGGLVIALLAAGRDIRFVLKRSLVTVALFTGVVTAAYIATALWRDESPWLWALRTNLRVLALSIATITTFRRIDGIRIAGSSRILQTLVVLVLSQTTALRRLVTDARLALRSRSPQRPGPRVLLRHMGATGGSLLRKAHHDLSEVSAAMASRGFYVDADQD